MGQALQLHQQRVQEPPLGLWGGIVDLVKDQYHKLALELPQVVHKTAGQVWNDPVGIVFSATTPCTDNGKKRPQTGHLDIRTSDPFSMRLVKTGEMAARNVTACVVEMLNDD